MLYFYPIKIKMTTTIFKTRKFNVHKFLKLEKQQQHYEKMMEHGNTWKIYINVSRDTCYHLNIVFC